MGQREVFEWLKMMRLTGDERFFLPKEIEKGLRISGETNGCLCNIRGDCFRLYMNGKGCIELKDFDTKGMTNWMKAFRIKEEYVKVK